MEPIFTADRPTFIVGGGASLRGFDWSRLGGQQVIVINAAYLQLRDAMVLFFGCDRYYKMSRDIVPKYDFWKFKGDHIYTTVEVCKEHPHIHYIDPPILGKGKKKFDSSGCNSGVQAICFAHSAGAGQIVLMGFDCKPGKWTGTPDATLAAYERYKQQFEALSKLKLDIVNTSEDSALTCFEKQALSEFI